jgi:hypothetical protein
MALSFRSVVALVTGAAFLFACAAEEAATKRKKKSPIDPGDEWYDDEIPTEEVPIEPTYVNEDSGAFQPAPGRPSSGAKDAGTPKVDGGTTTDGGIVTKTFCATPLAAGDLAVVELLIASRTGSGDDGEWLEVQNTHADCWLKLTGVTVESPRGLAQPNVATVTDGLELAPLGTFVVADSTDPLKNGGLKGTVFAFNATDVLKNDGDSVLIKMGTTTIDTITYPGFSNLETGRTLSFPSDCKWTDRASWDRWSLSFDSWSAGKRGTPNAVNGDVACF